MDPSDPRKQYLDQALISQIPAYAFPMGYVPIRDKERPKPEFLPMIFNSGEEKTHLQYLIFYESLEGQYKKAYELNTKVQEKMDAMNFENDSWTESLGKLSNNGSIEDDEHLQDTKMESDDNLLFSIPQF